MRRGWKRFEILNCARGDIPATRADLFPPERKMKSDNHPITPRAEVAENKLECAHRAPTANTTDERQLRLAAESWNYFIDRNGSFAEQYSTL